MAKKRKTKTAAVRCTIVGCPCLGEGVMAAPSKQVASGERPHDPEALKPFDDQKYIVKRTDGSHKRGRKHEACRYFVLDLAHDKFSIPALRAYAGSCAVEFPQLSADLHRLIEQLEWERECEVGNPFPHQESPSRRKGTK